MKKTISQGPSRLVALALALAAPGAALAQAPLTLPTSSMDQARAAEARNDPAEALARYLRVLSTNPRSLEALTGAGRAALDIEDPNAATGFYARAEEIAPRDGRIKAGLAAALVQMEQPRDALRLFAAAASLGTPESTFAGDRGLAYDLIGDNRRAQADYQTALRYRYERDIVLRLATSLAISGDRDGALQQLDPLLRQQDKAAWRTRTFVHALTGDTAVAAQLADILMPSVQAAQMKPFLARLSSLSATEKALAVHFGHFPTGAGRTTVAEALPVPGAPQPGIPASLITPPASSTGTQTARSSQQRQPRLSRREERRLAEQRALEAQREAEALRQRPSVTPISSAPAYAAVQSSRAPAFQSPVTTPTPTQQPQATPPRRTATAAVPSPAPTSSAAPLRVATAQPTPGPTPTGPASVAGSTSLAVAQPSPGATPRPAGVGGPTSTATSAPQPAAAAPRPASPEPAFASLADVMPASTSTASQAAASTSSSASAAPATSESTPGIRSVEVAPSAAAEKPRVYGPVPLPEERRPTALAMQTATLAAKPASEPLRVEPKPEPKPAAVAKPAPAKPKPVDEEAAKATKPPVDSAKKETAKESAATKGKTASDAKASEEKSAKADPKNPKSAKDSKTAAKDDKKVDDKKTAGAKKAADAKKAAAKEPSRVWVQVAGGADKAALPREWSKLKAKHGDLLAGQTAWTTPLRFTNRLLIGPFKSFAASQEFVNKAGKAGLSSFTFTSEEGQAVERLGAK